ncbi:double-stranded RNA-binding protein 1-like isoform X2 [Durio zibethinus]|nr:double-stranded RNA-binding protein 1-like isoform X2 [Durio zibethinus]
MMLSKRKRRKNPKLENPSSDLPQPDLFNQPSAPVQAPAFVQVPPSASPQAQSIPSGPLEPLMYKNRLQEYTQRSSIPLPVYQTFNEGLLHAPRFRSSVIVDGICYVSGETFSHRKAAEQDVAKYALECITKKIKDEGCPLIPEDTVFCKSILNEFAVKMNLEMPTYNTIQFEGFLPLFVSSLVFNGVTYSGETGRNKKEAEQLAARAVIVSLLDDPRYGTFLPEIIESKSKLYVALNKVKDSSIFHLGTTAAGAETLIHNNKEVETAAAPNSVPTSAILQRSSGAERPHHKFQITKSEQGPECVDLPISFVPPVVGQSSGVGENSTRKRRKKKKRAKPDTATQ